MSACATTLLAAVVMMSAFFLIEAVRRIASALREVARAIDRNTAELRLSPFEDDDPDDDGGEPIPEPSESVVIPLRRAS
jgi:hypothetical protein